MGSMHWGEYYWVIKWDEAPTPTTQTDLGNVTLSERSQTQKAARRGIPFVWKVGQ